MKTPIFGLTALALAGSVSAATLYEDTFDGDGLATNAKTGGGLVARTIVSGTTATFDDTGDLVDLTGNNGADRGVISSINSFSLTDGFTLEVHMVGGSTALLQSFGLSKTQFTADTLNQDWMHEAPWAGEGANGDAYGIGIETGTASDDGLKFNNGTGNATAMTNLVTTTGSLLPAGTNTFVLTVTPDDQFSYSYNGGAAVTGDIDPDGGFDLSNPLYFNIFSQSDIQLSYVKISEVPEPTSLALLGLGGLLVARRRRG